MNDNKVPLISLGSCSTCLCLFFFFYHFQPIFPSSSRIPSFHFHLFLSLLSLLHLFPRLSINFQRALSFHLFLSPFFTNHFFRSSSTIVPLVCHLVVSSLHIFSSHAPSFCILYFAILNFSFPLLFRLSLLLSFTFQAVSMSLLFRLRFSLKYSSLLQILLYLTLYW